MMKIIYVSIFLILVAQNLIAEGSKKMDYQTLIESRCLDCHDDDLKKGGLDLYEVDFNDTKTWTLIHDRVKGGEMPPKKKGKKRMSEQEVNAFTTTLKRKIIDLELNKKEKVGRSQWRRLNREEYENSLRDLLDMPNLNVAEALPPDGEDHGFSKSAGVLDISNAHLETYLEIAEMTLNQVLHFPQNLPKINKKKYYAIDQRDFPFFQPVAIWGRWHMFLNNLKPLPFNRKELNKQRKNLELEKTSVALFRSTFDRFFNQISIPYSGEYNLKLKARSVIRQTEMAMGPGPKPDVANNNEVHPSPVKDEVWSGKRHEPVSINASLKIGPRSYENRFLDIINVPASSAEEFKIKTYLQKGETIGLDPFRLPRPMLPAQPRRLKAIDPDGFPGVAFQWIEVEGPHYESWPPKPYKVLFGDLPYQSSDQKKVWSNQRVSVITDHPRRDGRKLLSTFMDRVMRHPSTEKDKEVFMLLFERLLEQKVDFTQAIITSYAAILSSPRYLFLKSTPGALNNYAMLERLSVFLSNSPLSINKGDFLNAYDLQKELEVEACVEAFLNNPKSNRFIETFCEQWLNLDQINATDPDWDLYPSYAGDTWLVTSMLHETRAFFRDMIENNLPISELIDSQSIMVNETLAKHYGIKGVQGPQLRKVPLPKASPYGGLITQASILKVTADGTTTSPVKRGVYIAEKILGVRIPKPPADISGAEPDTRGAKTIRDILAKHTSNNSCASCHSKFDAFGFALENFDVMGKWYENYHTTHEGEKVTGMGRGGQLYTYFRGRNIDASYQLEDGRSFKDVLGLKSMLKDQNRQVAKNFIKHLSLYATGADILMSDRADVDTILNECQDSGYRVRDLIHSFVKSPLFKNK